MAEKPLPSFGRRLGRALSPRKKMLLEEVLPQWQCPLPAAGEIVDPSTLFGNNNPVWMEIGFGAGEHLLHLARRYPETNFIGAEPFLNGVVRLLADIDRQGVTNIRILPDDARLLLNSLPDDSLARVDILFPDPWHKSRHHKRRLVNKELLDLLARVMKPDSTLWLATDHYDYSAWMLERLLAHSRFCWEAKNCQDWQQPPADWYQTRYETKKAKNAQESVFLQFTR